MASLKDLKPQSRFKVLIYGDSGAGKTCFAAGFPGPVFVADFDNKISSAAAYYQNSDQLGQIDYESYGSLGSQDFPAERFNNKMGEFRALIKKNEFKYQTIVLDSLTTFSDEAMKYLMKENPGIKRVVTRGAQSPSQQDYGIARIFFKQFISELVTFPCNLIVTAHIETTKDETTGEIARTPMLAGKLKHELPIYFEEVYRAYTDKDGKHRAQTRSDSKFQCRTQIRGIPPAIPLAYSELAKQR